MTASQPRAGTTRTAAGARDLRLDFFRGLGLLFIFLDHIPDNWVSYLTLANVVFCDAAEIFVFISGISAALVFGRIYEREGYVFAAAQALRRTWTLYVAHVFLFVIFTAQVSYAAQRWKNPLFAEEMNIAGFLDDPAVAIVKALTLQLQPMFMGILPLYIVLLIGLAVLLPVLCAAIDVVLVAGVGLWLAVQLLGFNLSAYPDGKWFHNPMAWQLLFLIGAAFGLKHHVRSSSSRLLRLPPFAVSAAFLGLCVAAKLIVTFAGRGAVVPEWFFDLVWQVSNKTNLGPLRLLCFLALAHVVVVAVPVDAGWLRSRLVVPIVRCGQHSLEIFCFGIFLSVAGHALLVEYGYGVVSEAAVSFGGCAILMAIAGYLAWSKGRERASRGAGGAPRTVPTGGEG